MYVSKTLVVAKETVHGVALSMNKLPRHFKLLRRSRSVYDIVIERVELISSAVKKFSTIIEVEHQSVAK